MKQFLEYRSNDYLSEHEQYLYCPFHSLMIGKIHSHQGNQWFGLPGMNIKATTTPCISLKELKLKCIEIRYKGYEQKGIIGGNGWGLTNSPYIYIYWGKLPTLKSPNLYALPDINQLEL